MKLEPCPECGASCRVEAWDSPHVKVTLWICSNNPHFGGNCPHTNGYLSADAWNHRTSPSSQSDDRWKDSRELTEPEKWDVEIARRNKVESQSDEALEPLGAEFEAVWDTNVDELYEFDIPRSDAGEEAGEPVASAPPASGTDEALVEEIGNIIANAGITVVWSEATAIARAILPILRAHEAAAHAAGRAEMRKEAVGYAKNLALEFEKGGAYDESVVATSLAEGICALGDKP